MNFDGFQPVAFERFSSLVEQADATSLPSGVSPHALNVRFQLTSVRTRDGIQSKYGFILPSGEPVTGLAGLKVGGDPDTFVPMAFDTGGNLYIESPAGSHQVTPVESDLVSPPTGASMQAAAAFKRGFLAFSDLKNSKGAGAVYDIASGQLYPLSMRPFGDPWAPGVFYNVGEVVTPSTPFGGNGHSYSCTVAGTSGIAQPAFPITEGGTVAEGGPGPTWQENTPQMVQALPEPPIPTVVRSAGAGTFAAGRDVYILVTLLNGNGETDGQTTLAFKFVNTTLNDRFVVSSPTLAAWVQALVPPYKVTGYNVYEIDVATGGGAPVLAAYKKVNGAPVPIGTNTNVDTTGAGAAPPTLNGATVVPLGNICSGLRYAIVLFLSKTGYIGGVSSAAIASYDAPNAGYSLYMPHIPTGPANTQARIVAFTPAGDLSQLAGNGISSAGPYFWIPPAGFVQADFDITKIAGGVTIADIVDGISMTSTLINDNTTTSATFSFTDDYLKSFENDVSDRFRNIQIPDLVDVQYSESMRRMFYRVDALPSGWYISAKDDPETVYGDAGFVQVAENNGENAVTVREFLGAVYLFKERSGHTLSEDVTDPSQWKPVKAWGGSGPCGPRAVDSGTSFLCYVHRSGVYIFVSGLPKLISKELPITWSKINWKYQHLIWVQIDDEYREIRIGVPYAGSTTPNLVLKCNFEESPDFEPPIHFSPYIGKEIATGSCYKWSVDDIPANLALRIERPLVNPPAFMDPATAQSQLLYASANPDGAVSAIVPKLLNDNSAGIDSVYETSAPQQLLKVNQLGGVQVNNNGVGESLIEVLSLRAKDPKDGGVVPPPGKPQANAGAVIPMKKPCTGGIPYSCGASGQNERFRLRFSNGKRADVGFDISWAAIMARPISSARPSK